MTYYLCSSIPSSFWNEVYSKTKEFAPTGSKFFPFGVDPFEESCLPSLSVPLKRKVIFVKKVPTCIYNPIVQKNLINFK